MAVRTKSFALDTYVANSATTIYTAGAAEETIIQAMALTNITAGAVTVTLHIYPSGGSASDRNAILKTKSLAANETYIVPGAINQVMPPGSVLAGAAGSANAINIIASGIVRT